MAVCRICGTEDKSLPEHWIAWECITCLLDLFRSHVHPITVFEEDDYAEMLNDGIDGDTT